MLKSLGFRCFNIWMSTNRILTVKQKLTISVLLRVLYRGRGGSCLQIVEHASAAAQGKPEDHQTQVLARVS